MYQDIPFKFRTKADLIAALQDRLKVAGKLDAEAIKKHSKDEAAYLKFFRARLREGLTMTYEQAKSNGFDVVSGRQYKSIKHVSGPELDVPDCPSAIAPNVQRAIDLVSRWTDPPAGEKVRPYMIRPTGQYAWIHRMLCIGATVNKGNVCT